MKGQTFYMVYLEGERSPTHKHETITSAEAEAKRLSKMYNKKAIILCSVLSFEINEFTVIDLRPSLDDLPF